MTDDDFDFKRLRERRVDRQTEVDRTKKVNRERLEATARTLAQAITRDFPPPIMASCEGTRVRVQSGKGGIMTISVLEHDKFEAQISGDTEGAEKFAGRLENEMRKDDMMEVIEDWAKF